MKCPGQDTQYWNPDAIFETECPECGHPMEFFKDDATRRCQNCRKKIVNPKMDFGCASYCQFAEQCLGTLPEEFIAKREDLLKDRVAVEMKRYFGTDFKRIGHAAKVANFAEKIGRSEKANLAVVLCSAYLRDIGIKIAQEKYNSSAPEHLEEEGPPVARDILARLGAQDALTDQVCEIISHHHPGKEDSLEARCIHDADKIANMVDCQGKNDLSPEEFQSKLDRIMMTDSGRQVAAKVLIEQ